MVWVFVEFVLPNGTPSGNFYPVLGPCPIEKDGTWTCTGVKVGKAGDYGKQFQIWAAIVTDGQAYTYAGLAVSPLGRDSFRPAGEDAPPHVTGAPGATDNLVIRCDGGQSCPAG
jgi:hypothetical protein